MYSFCCLVRHAAGCKDGLARHNRQPARAAARILQATQIIILILLDEAFSERLLARLLRLVRS